jgi:hypothetical protein
MQASLGSRLTHMEPMFIRSLRHARSWNRARDPRTSALRGQLWVGLGHSTPVLCPGFLRKRKLIDAGRGCARFGDDACRGLGWLPRGGRSLPRREAPERFDHFLVRDLLKVGVKGADRAEDFVPFDANEIVGLAAQVF